VKCIDAELSKSNCDNAVESMSWCVRAHIAHMT